MARTRIDSPHYHKALERLNKSFSLQNHENDDEFCWGLYDGLG